MYHSQVKRTWSPPRISVYGFHIFLINFSYVYLYIYIERERHTREGETINLPRAGWISDLKFVSMSIIATYNNIMTYIIIKAIQPVNYNHN
ncbi:hypothetical protein Hanom_Chr07g00673461 [Helianthus anomalus]